MGKFTSPPPTPHMIMAKNPHLQDNGFIINRILPYICAGRARTYGWWTLCPRPSRARRWSERQSPGPRAG